MLGQLLKFELRYHFGQLTFKATALLFLCLGAIAVQGGFGSSEVHKNAPHAIAAIVSLLSLLSIFASTLFAANVVLRDRNHNMEALLFTTSIKRIHYFIVRCMGLVIAVTLLLVLATIGIYIGTLFFSPEQLGPTHVYNYVHPLLLFGLPNVLFSAGVIVCVALVTKHVSAVYATGVLLYILYMLASIFGNSPLLATSTLKLTEPDLLSVLLDPFGLSAFYGQTKNWTDLQRNQDLFPLSAGFLANRLCWILVVALLFSLSYRFFTFRLAGPDLPRPGKKTIDQQAPLVFRHFDVDQHGFAYYFASFWSQFKLEIYSLFRHMPLLVMLALWLFIFSIELNDTLLRGGYGIRSYPVTGIIIEAFRNMKLGFILLVFYAAELIGREKAVNIESLIYATPVRYVVLWAAKCLTLMLLVFVLVSLNIGVGIALQITHGDFNFEIAKYLSLYYYAALPMCLFVLLIVFVQNLSANKYIGMLLSMLAILVILLAERFGIEHYLFRFATVPELQYSYFNQFGHYSKAFNWYMLYWTGLSTILGIATVGMWQNGRKLTFTLRLRSLGLAISANKVLFTAASVVWLGCGIFIYYQSNVIGAYQNKADRLSWLINYEKKYRSMAGLSQPMVKSIKMDVYLFPKTGRYRIKGSYQVKNESNVPISVLWLSVAPEVNKFEIKVTGNQKSTIDHSFKQQFIQLKTPLLPNAVVDLDFTIEVLRSGFVPFNNENSVVANGSYIELEKYVPQFGYRYQFQTTAKVARRKAGLPEVPLAEPADNVHHLITLETTIATDAGQHVLTVGTLQQSWIAGQRSYFRYKSNQPIRFMFALSSARYALKSEKHKGMPLSIYYQKGQEQNLTAMFKAIKDALDYGTKNYGVYPFTQFTMAEIPQYRGAATAYPGLIFSAERINFLSDYRDSTRVNHSYAVTAHEVAHQWWANQFSPVNGPGQAMLTESLAKYTEYVLIERQFTKMYLRNYLKAEQNLYFSMRNYGEAEQPLTQASDQAYVYYQKGGLVMYAMKELMGEVQFNAILAKLIADHTSPKVKATPIDFVNALMDMATPKQKQFIKNSFDEVVNYEMGIKVLSCLKRDDGKFELALEIDIEQHELGKKEGTAPAMYVDLALFNQADTKWNNRTQPIYLKKHWFEKKKNKLTVVINERPKVVAIDPYHYLLDPDDSRHTATIR